MDGRAAHSGAHSVSACMQAAREGKLAQLTSREGRRLASLLAKLGQLEDAHAIAQVLARCQQKLLLLAVVLPKKHAMPPCWVAGVADEQMHQELWFAITRQRLVRLNACWPLCGCLG